MAVDVLGEVMRNGTYRGSWMNARTEDIHLYSGFISFVAYNTSCFIQSFGKKGYRPYSFHIVVTNFQTLNIIVPVQIHCLLHTNFILFFLFDRDTIWHCCTFTDCISSSVLFFKKFSESFIRSQTSITVTPRLHQYQSKKRISATALSPKQHWGRGGVHTRTNWKHHLELQWQM